MSQTRPAPASGAIALAGSGEFTAAMSELDRTLVGPGMRVVALTQAAAPDGAEVQESWAQMARDYFSVLGVEVVTPLGDPREPSGRSEILALIGDSQLLWISGGDPLWLKQGLSGLERDLARRSGGGLHIAGSSAGAMALGLRTLPKLEESPRWRPGLGVLGVGIIPHFNEQPALRLQAMLEGAGSTRVIGIDAETALVVRGHGRVVGRGRVHLIEDGETVRVIEAPPPVGTIVPPIPDGCGPLLMMSSDEFTDRTEASSRALIEARGPRVAVLLCADPEQAEQQRVQAVEHLGRLGASPIWLDVLDREHALRFDLPACDSIFVGGGSPATLVAQLKDTPLWDQILARWQAGAGLAGSSAGAMALARDCLYPGPQDDLPWDWSDGLGPLQGFGLAVHAGTRPLEWLRRITETAPVPVVALADGTALLVTSRNEPAVIGTGDVWVAQEDSLLSPNVLGRGMTEHERHYGQVT